MSPVDWTLMTSALNPTFDSPKVAKARLPTHSLVWWIVVY